MLSLRTLLTGTTGKIKIRKRGNFDVYVTMLYSNNNLNCCLHIK